MEDLRFEMRGRANRGQLEKNEELKFGDEVSSEGRCPKRKM